MTVCKNTNDFEQLDETAQYGRSRDYIVHVEGTLINEIVNAEEKGNQKLVDKLKEKRKEVAQIHDQITNYEIRKRIVCEHIEMLQEIQTIIKAHQE